jgi:hypothetical protein
VQIIRLPRHLDGLDLAALNQRLHAGEVRLDWTNVEPNIPVTYLYQLFTGLSLADNIDTIGADTIPLQLQPAIQTVFNTLEARTAPSSPTPDGAPPSPINEPIALWLPPQTTSAEADGASPPPVPAAITEHSTTGSSSTLNEPSSIYGTDNTRGYSAPAPARILEKPSSARLRDLLQDMVLRDLLGPAGGPQEELDEQRVHDRYLIGMLAPSKTQTIPEELEELADAEEGGPGEGTEDADTLQTVSFNPASLGMSFCVDATTTALLVTARWGHYRRADSESLN